MRMLSRAFTPRFICYTLSILFTATLLLIILAVPQAIYVAGVPLALFARLHRPRHPGPLQTRHVVLRIIPISAHLRFLLEDMRPVQGRVIYLMSTTGAAATRFAAQPSSTR